MTNVNCRSFLVERSSLEREFTNGVPSSLFGYSIDHAPGATPAKNHSVGPFQYFDSLYVIEVTEILNVIAHAISEKISCRAIAAKDKCIAISFALRYTHARHVTRHVSHALHRLVPD